MEEFLETLVFVGGILGIGICVIGIVFCVVFLIKL